MRPMLVNELLFDIEKDEYQIRTIFMCLDHSRVLRIIT